jgi:predicted transposase YbfD/YdcC
LLDDITTCFLEPGQPHFETSNKGHGRLEQRKIWCSEALNSFVNFPYAAQIFRIDREITQIKSKKTTHETAYGISSLCAAKADPARILSIVRGHWSIENRLHYVRDTTFDEDRSSIRSATGQRVMASLRNLVIGLIRLQNPGKYIPAVLRQNAMKPHLALKLMGY